MPFLYDVEAKFSICPLGALVAFHELDLSLPDIRHFFLQSRDQGFERVAHCATPAETLSRINRFELYRACFPLEAELAKGIEMLGCA